MYVEVKLVQGPVQEVDCSVRDGIKKMKVNRNCGRQVEVWMKTEDVSRLWSRAAVSPVQITFLEESSEGKLLGVFAAKFTIRRSQRNF